MTTDRREPHDPRTANRPPEPADGADSAEAAQHREDQSEIGDRIGVANDGTARRDRSRRSARPLVR
jgi:hypothetical protein